MGRARGHISAIATNDAFSGTLGNNRGVSKAAAAERERLHEEAMAAQRERWEAKNEQGARAKALTRATRDLSFNPNYGVLFWHNQRGHVWWISGPDDGPGTGTSSPWAVEHALAAVEHVNAVSVAVDEPPSDCGANFNPQTGELENGWRVIGHDAQPVFEFEADDKVEAAIAEDAAESAKWLSGEGANRVGSTWVRPQHEDEIVAYNEAMAELTQED